MAHLIPEYDADPHFSIDADTQELIYESEEELTFMQGDHNSKRITFELPRYVDWHDISLCNKVRVHFININAEDPELRVEDTYKVDDLHLCPDDEENTVVCSWLVSKHSTKYAGTLNFVVSFLVINDETKEIEYSWNTMIYADIPVRECYDHGESTVVKYADILEEWHQKLIDDSTSGVNEILRAQNEALDILEAMKEDVIDNVGVKNDEVLGIIDEAKNQAVAEIEQETQDSINVIAEYGGIAVSETEPTNDKIDFWIHDLPEDQQEIIDLPTKDDMVGIRDKEHNSAVYDDMNNNTALGAYSSAHGKSSKNFNSIAKPEKIYYKALPGTVGYDSTLLEETGYSIWPPYDFDYLYWKLEEIYNPEITSKEIAIDIYYYTENGDYTTKYYSLDANGELRIPASELLTSFESWDSGEVQVTRLEICPCVNPDDVDLKVYAVTERGDIYDFESLQFTTDSTDALGEVNKVYSYVDKWGNTRYTLWQDYHPDAKKTDEFIAKGKIAGDLGVIYLNPETEYKIELTEEFIEYNPTLDLFERYPGYNEYIYVNESGPTNETYHNTFTISDGNIVAIKTPESTDDSAFTLVWNFTHFMMTVGTLYEKAEVTLVNETPTTDPIYTVILYEALVNGGESFSLADGEASTVFGKDNITKGYGAIASGRNSIAAANYSLALGKDTEARGPGAFAVGLGGKATGMYSFAANEKGVASGYASTVIGDHCASTNYYSISGGYKSKSSGHSAMAIGFTCEANGMSSVALGGSVKAGGDGSIALGMVNEATGNSSAAIGRDNKVSGNLGIAIGTSNINDGCGVGIGESNKISDNGYAFGKANKVNGYNAVAALGAANTITESAFNGAVAVGHKNTISGEASCALGAECKSKGLGSVALGRKSEANGRSAIAAGLSAIANGTDSVAIGRYSKAAGDYQTVLGRANAPISGMKAVLIVGTGMYDTEESRKNGLVVYEAGNVTIGADPINAMDVVTKQYLESKIAELEARLSKLS
jgi:hypothetical protein